LQWQGTTETGAGKFAFGAKVKNAPKCDSRTDGGTSTVAFWRADAFADVFRRGALSRTAGRVWLVILGKPLRAAQIAARLHQNVGTIRKALAKLAAHNLARCVDGVWLGENADTAQLERIADNYATRFKAQRRRERHKHERAQDVTNQIVNARYKATRIELLQSLRAGSSKL